ncbi:hypothetical protein [Paenibacillus sp. SI8]|uniref:hypothetical protein n=1 Tax=unclassified Paenibacillus TaxID=185978 RepID=UPI003467B02E
MKKEELITPAELHALLAENGEDVQMFGTDELMGAQHLISLQKAVVLLSRQVESLQDQLHEHFQAQHKHQEQLLRQFKYQIEQQLHLELSKGLEQTQPDNSQENEPKAIELSASELTAPSAPSEEPATYSRVKSYSKIRKRKKSFIEKLFE